MACPCGKADHPELVGAPRDGAPPAPPSRCWMHANLPGYRALYDGDGPVVAPAAGANACARLGPVLGTAECQTCTGRVALKVYACAVHGRCTLGRRADDVPGCCAGCPDLLEPKES